MAKAGKFIINNLMGQTLDLFISLDSEWLSYQDGESQSYTILIAVPKKYDEDSGILTMVGEQGHEFYLSEDSIDMFWKHNSGFAISHNATSSLKPKKVYRDIM
jgi:hypothetical protein